MHKNMFLSPCRVYRSIQRLRAEEFTRRKYEDGQIQTPECHDSDWSLHRLWPLSLHRHALHDLWRTLLLPEEAPTGADHRKQYRL